MVASRVVAFLAPLWMVACGGETTGTSRSVGGGAGGPSVIPAEENADWKMLGYDLASTYWNRFEQKISRATAARLRMAWAFDTQGSVTSTPLVSGGRVYVLSSAGVIALDLVTGTELWRVDSVTGSSTLALDDGVLYANDGAGVVHALDSNQRGRQLWEYAPVAPWSLVGFSSPVVTKDYVIVGASSVEEVGILPGDSAKTRGFVLALNKADGTLAWRKYTVEPPGTAATVWSSAAVDEPGGLVVVSTGNNYTGPASDTSDAFLGMALRQPPDGAALRWHQQILAGDVTLGGNGPDGDFGANPILYEVNGQKFAAGGAKNGDVWVIDRSSGAIVSQRNLGPGSAFKGGIFVNGAWDGKSLLFACNLATSVGPGSEGSAAALFALDPLTLDVKWERGIGGTVWGPLSVANGAGFFGNDKTLQAFDTENGQVLAEFPTEGSIATAPAVSNGYVVFGSGMSWISSTAGTKYYALRIPPPGG